MLSIFNIVRLSIYAAVIAWTLIVLGLAAHLEHLLVSNDLTRFIPLAIFVSVCTLLIIPALLIFGFIRRPFPIQQTRVELAFVGLLGLLWFILGIVTASEPDTEVECDFDGDGNWEETDEFSTETFYAQYHTIEAFAIFNAILLFIFFLLLLLLSYRQHRLGRNEVWTAPVTRYPFLGAPTEEEENEKAGLPKPVTDKSFFGKKGGKAEVLAAGSFGTTGAPGTEPMKAGGHYIIYIPPPPPRS